MIGSFIVNKKISLWYPFTCEYCVFVLINVKTVIFYSQLEVWKISVEKYKIVIQPDFQHARSYYFRR